MIGREVELQVGDKCYRLVPTLRAMKAVEQHYGDILAAARKVASLSLDATCKVVTAGAGLSSKQADALEEEVFAAGIVNVVGPVSDFLGILMNPTGEEAKDDDSGNA